MQQFEFVVLHETKVLHREKVLKQIVESLHLNTMAVSYHLQFANYKIGEKKWFDKFLFLCGIKLMYITQAAYLDSVCVKGTLKDDLCDKWKINKNKK